MEKIVADNLRRLMKHNKQANPSVAARELKMSQQQVDRALKGQRIRIDTLEFIARGYGLEPYQMMIPGLDPANPQILRLLGPAEEKLYVAFKEAVEETGKRHTP